MKDPKGWHQWKSLILYWPCLMLTMHLPYLLISLTQRKRKVLLFKCNHPPLWDPEPKPHRPKYCQWVTLTYLHLYQNIFFREFLARKYRQTFSHLVSWHVSKNTKKRFFAKKGGRELPLLAGPLFVKTKPLIPWMTRQFWPLLFNLFLELNGIERKKQQRLKWAKKCRSFCLTLRCMAIVLKPKRRQIKPFDESGC